MLHQLNSVATSAHCINQFYIHPSLKSSSHIFLRIHCVQPLLRHPYTEPHKVLSRIDKAITIYVNSRKTTASLYRVKPGHFLSETVCESPSTVSESVNDGSRNNLHFKVCDVPWAGDIISPPLMRPMSEGMKDGPLNSAVIKSVYYDLNLYTIKQN
ncbi:transposon Ty3-G Gag-Pol polyprotein [Trichonephila clavipes]|nr:transposon Ty3-G Gag-Pol polyprotein [Trichonephila clavipes]